MDFDTYVITSQTDVTKHTIVYDPETWAQILGMSCNKISSIEAIMYKGSNPNVGIYVGMESDSGTARLRTKGYINGTEVGGINYISNSTTVKSYLFYKKTDKGCAFGFGSGTDTIQINFFWTTGTYLDTAEDAYCYLTTNGTNYPYIYTEDGESDEFRGGANVDNQLVVLIPGVIKSCHFLCKYCYASFIFYPTVRAMIFVLDGNRYVTGKSRYDSTQKIALRL